MNNVVSFFFVEKWFHQPLCFYVFLILFILEALIWRSWDEKLLIFIKFLSFRSISPCHSSFYYFSLYCQENPTFACSPHLSHSSKNFLYKKRVKLNTFGCFQSPDIVFRIPIHAHVNNLTFDFFLENHIYTFSNLWALTFVHIISTMAFP